MFLPSAWFTAVLPPTAESTIAMSVVGTCCGIFFYFYFILKKKRRRARA